MLIYSLFNIFLGSVNAILNFSYYLNVNYVKRDIVLRLTVTWAIITSVLIVVTVSMISQFDCFQLLSST